MKTLIKILRLSDVNCLMLLPLLLLGLFSSLLSVLPIEIMRIFGESIERGYSTSVFSWVFLGLSITNVLNVVLIFFISSVFYIVLRNVYGFLATVFTDKIIHETQKRLFFNLLKKRYQYHLEVSHSKNTHLLISDTQRLELIFSQPFYTAFSDLLDLVWISVFIFSIDPKSFLLFISVTPLIIVSSKFVGKKQRGLFGNIQQLESDKMERADYSFKGIDSIKGFQTEIEESNVFNSYNDKIIRYKKDASFKLALFFPLEGLIKFSSISIALLFYLTGSSHTSGVSAVSLIAFSLRFFAPISNFNKYYQTFQSGLASADRILKAFETNKLEMIDDKKIISNKIENLEIENLEIPFIKGGISYPNIKISAGDHIHIKGESGRGKSLFAKALLGLIDFKGTIYINGDKYDSESMISLRSHFTYVSQDPLIIPGSLIDNISYGADCTQNSSAENVIKELRLSHLMDRKKLEPGSYSGGERKRIAMARALLSNGNIIILDEVNSNLDAKSREILENLICRSFFGKMLIIISHSNLFDKNIKVKEI